MYKHLLLFQKLVLLLLTITCFQATNTVLQAQNQKAYVYFFLEEECPMCQYYTQDLQKIYEKYSVQGIDFQGVFPFANASEAGINSFAEKYQIPFSLKKDEGQVITQLFKATVTPEVIVTDTQGEIKYRGRIDNAFVRPGKRRRVVTQHELTNALDAILQDDEVVVPETQVTGCFITLLKKTQ